MASSSSTTRRRVRSGSRLGRAALGALVLAPLLMVSGITEAKDDANDAIVVPQASGAAALLEEVMERLEPFFPAMAGTVASTDTARPLPPPIASLDPADPDDGIAGPLIVGGEPILITEAPWQVMLVDLDPDFWPAWPGWALRSFPPQDYRQFCGGSILDEYTIITAAHCVDDPFFYEWLHVVAGETYAYGADEQGLNPSTFIGVAEVIVHPDWDDRTYDNDIALLILETPLTLGAAVSPIAMPTQDPLLWPDTSSSAVVTGWGTTAFGAIEIVNQLRRGVVEILAAPVDPVCGDYGPAYNRVTMLCAGLPTGGVDACQGDSGGPLAVDNGVTWFLAGITSWGNECGLADYPGIYTRVTTYLDWIEETLASVCDPAGIPFGGGDGSAADPYLICSPTHLDNVRDELNSSFRQTRSIELAGAWTPIGSAADPFEGTYDGAEKLISGIRIDAEGVDYVGLFGSTDGAEISNLGLLDVDIVGADFVGGLVGYADDTTISNVLVLGESSFGPSSGPVIVLGQEDVGAVIGRAGDSVITQVLALGVEVNGERNVGGVAGSLSETTAAALFTSNGGIHGTADSVGGVVGLIAGTRAEPIDFVIAQDVEVEGASYVGGLFGQVQFGLADTEITRLIGFVDVTATEASSSVGGIAGRLTSSGGEHLISQGVVTAMVTGGSETAGAFGEVTAGSESPITLSQLTTLAVVEGSDNTGGLIGRAEGAVTLQDVSTLGFVGGASHVGGLVGTFEAEPAEPTLTIERAFTAGIVDGDSDVGGLIGRDLRGAEILASFWNATANPDISGVGTISPDPAGVIGATQTALQQRSTFAGAGWPIIELTGVAPAVNGYVWGICSGEYYPELLFVEPSCSDLPPDPPVPPRPPGPPRPPLPPDGPRPPAPGSGIFTGIEPTRVLDTRPNPVVAGTTLRLDLASMAPTGATGVVLNLTAVDPAATGFLSVVPCDAGPASISNLNVSAGVTVANAVITGIGAQAELCITTSVGTNVLVDVTGWFTGGFVPLPPDRVFDTRGLSAAVAPAGSVTRVVLGDVPGGAVGAAINVAAVDPQASGYLTVFDCGVQPNTSTANFVAGSNAASQTVTGLSSNREVCIFTSAATEIIVDVFGWFGSIFAPIEPVRLLDTRQGAPVAAGSITRVVVAGQGGISSGARAIAATVTSVGSTQAGYATLFPCRQSPPNASTLNFDAGATVANSGYVSLDAEGAVCIFSSVSGNYLLDATGWFDSRSLR